MICLESIAVGCDGPDSLETRYHLRPSPSSLLAWEVDRLIDPPAHLQRVEVPGDFIHELDEPFWFAGRSGKPPVARWRTTPG